jgi:hypothetical protein
MPGRATASYGCGSLLVGCALLAVVVVVVSNHSSTTRPDSVRSPADIAGSQSNDAPPSEVGNGTSAPTKHFERLAAGGFSHVVWIDPRYKRDAQIYEQAIAELGGDDRICQITFWDNRQAMPPTTGIMTDEQVNSRVAAYQRNRNTAYERFYYIENGKMVEPFGTRPSNTPQPSAQAVAGPPDAHEADRNDEPPAVNQSELHGTPPRGESKSSAATKSDSEVRRAKADAAKWHTWTIIGNDSPFEAKFGGMSYKVVKLFMHDGSTLKVPFDNLSSTDQEFITDQKWAK